jgi:hypothetical protein
MGTNALLVLDGIRDVERVLGELTVSGSSDSEQQIADSFRDDVCWIEHDSDYHPDAPKADRLYIQMLCRYWYPGELHYSPGNWPAVSRVCQTLWNIESDIVVHYMPDYVDIDELTEQLVTDAHRLTPSRVAELDEECNRAQFVREQLNLARAQSRANDRWHGLDGMGRLGPHCM